YDKMCIASAMTCSVCLGESLSVSCVCTKVPTEKKNIVCVIHPSCAGYLLPKLPSKRRAVRRTQMNGISKQSYVYRPKPKGKQLQYNSFGRRRRTANREGWVVVRGKAGSTRVVT
ncbi:hypothetical protein JI435_404650, partial [Parastagonospora nodorum SN15]